MTDLLDDLTSEPIIVTEKGMQEAAEILARDGCITGDEKDIVDMYQACNKWVKAFKVRDKSKDTDETLREAILIEFVREMLDQIRLKTN